jgi:excisionase family DNA binding protein
MASDDTSTSTDAETTGTAGGSTDWLSTKEAARRLGITARTLYRFIDEGQLPAYRFGRVIRLKPADIDAYIESCRIEPGTLEHLYPEPNAPSA